MVAAPAVADSRDDAVATTRAWADAFSRHDLEGLLRLYDREAVFWGTSSPVLRDTPEAIREYFKGVPTSTMTVEIGDHRARVFGDIAVVTGSYTFVTPRDGGRSERPARFSFTLRRGGDGWRIVDHHSSAVPMGR